MEDRKGSLHMFFRWVGLTVKSGSSRTSREEWGQQAKKSALGRQHWVLSETAGASGEWLLRGSKFGAQNPLFPEPPAV